MANAVRVTFAWLDVGKTLAPATYTLAVFQTRQSEFDDTGRGRPADAHPAGLVIEIIELFQNEGSSSSNRSSISSEAIFCSFKYLSNSREKSRILEISPPSSFQCTAAPEEAVLVLALH